MASFGSADIREINESEKTRERSSGEQKIQMHLRKKEVRGGGGGVGASSTAGKDLVINAVKKNAAVL